MMDAFFFFKGTSAFILAGQMCAFFRPNFRKGRIYHPSKVGNLEPKLLVTFLGYFSVTLEARLGLQVTSGLRSGNLNHLGEGLTSSDLGCVSLWVGSFHRCFSSSTP